MEPTGEKPVQTTPRADPPRPPENLSPAQKENNRVAQMLLRRRQNLIIGGIAGLSREEREQRFSQNPGDEELNNALVFEQLDQAKLSASPWNGDISGMDKYKITIVVQGGTRTITKIDGVDGDNFSCMAVDSKGNSISVVVDRTTLVNGQLIVAEQKIVDTFVGADQQAVIRAYIDYLKGTDISVTEESIEVAARAVGMETRETVLAFAREHDLITEDEATQIAESFKPKTDEPEAEKPKESSTTDDKTKKPEETASVVALSEKARQLQTALTESPVISPENLVQILDLLDISHSVVSLSGIAAKKSNQLNGLRLKFQSMMQSGQPEKAQEATRDIEKLEKEIDQYAQVLKGLEPFIDDVQDWDLVTMFYNGVESGDIEPQGQTLLEFADGFMKGKDEKILNNIVGEDKIKDAEARKAAKERKDRAWKTGKNIFIMGGGGLAGLMGLMAFFGLRKKEQ
jgi:hypothetical protein